MPSQVTFVPTPNGPIGGSIKPPTPTQGTPVSPNGGGMPAPHFGNPDHIGWHPTKWFKTKRGTNVWIRTKGSNVLSKNVNYPIDAEVVLMADERQNRRFEGGGQHKLWFLLMKLPNGDPTQLWVPFADVEEINPNAEDYSPDSGFSQDNGFDYLNNILDKHSNVQLWGTLAGIAGIGAGVFLGYKYYAKNIYAMMASAVVGGIVLSTAGYKVGAYLAAKP